MERWDAYDRDFKKVQGVTLIRGEKIPENYFHLVCDIIVRHADGSYLVMQRDKRKHLGGMWEATAGGSALLLCLKERVPFCYNPLEKKTRAESQSPCRGFRKTRGESRFSASEGEKDETEL